MTWWTVYLAVWLAATLAGLALTACFRRWASTLGFLDRPGAETHKRHARSIPLLGGPAMFLAMSAVLFGGLLLAAGLFRGNAETRIAPHLPGAMASLGRLAIIVGGAGAMLILGLVDDRRPLRASHKIIVQIAICGLVAAFGVRITAFIPHPLVNWLITLFWMLLVVNAINIFDNMDGMAGGCGLTAALLFFLIAALQEQYFVALLAAALGGSVLGFLYFNWPPARIFMGDSGSHFLGYMLAVLGALTTYYSPTRANTSAALLIPLLILALPIFDLFAVVLLRLRQGTPIYQGDNQHISHRFRMLGLSRGQTAAVVHLLGLAVGAGALPLLWLPARAAVVVFLQAGAMLALVSILHAIHIRQQTGESNE